MNTGPTHSQTMHRSLGFSRHLLSAAATALLAFLPLAAAEPVAPSSPTLWYRQPAANWNEALPIGNGRLGAMVFGGVARERFQLNEDTLSAGGPYNQISPEGRDALPEIRRLIAAGRYAEAQALADAKFMSRPIVQAPYQTVGDLFISFSGAENVQDYRRELNLDTAVARTEFRVGNTVYTRECFSTAVDQVIAIRLTAHEVNAAATAAPARFSFSLSMETPQSAQVAPEGERDLVMRGRNGGFANVPSALSFEARVRVPARNTARVARRRFARHRRCRSVRHDFAPIILRCNSPVISLL